MNIIRILIWTETTDYYTQKLKLHTNCVCFDLSNVLCNYNFILCLAYVLCVQINKQNGIILNFHHTNNNNTTTIFATSFSVSLPSEKSMEKPRHTAIFTSYFVFRIKFLTLHVYWRNARKMLIRFRIRFMFEQQFHSSLCKCGA